MNGLSFDAVDGVFDVPFAIAAVDDKTSDRSRRAAGGHVDPLDIEGHWPAEQDLGQRSAIFEDRFQIRVFIPQLLHRAVELRREAGQKRLHLGVGKQLIGMVFARGVGFADSGRRDKQQAFVGRGPQQSFVRRQGWNAQRQAEPENRNNRRFHWADTEHGVLSEPEGLPKGVA